MFCGKCGTQIPDGAGFCPSCGNATGAQATAPTQTVTTPKKKMSTNTIIGVVAAAAVVLALVIILICVFAGGGASGAGSAEAVVEKYVDASLDMDADALFDCIHPDVFEAAAEEEYDGDVDAFKDELRDQIDQYKEMMDSMGSEIKMSCDIIDSEDIEGDELDEFKEDFESEYDIEISAAAIVTVEQTTEGTVMGQEINNTETSSITAVKIDGKWYIHPDDFDIG